MTQTYSKKNRSELTTEEKKKLRANVMFSDVGRPLIGITDDKASAYRNTITRWIDNGALDEKLFNKKDYFKASEAFNKLTSGKTLHDRLEIWKNDYLSLYGWERLQANIRQKNYKRGTKKETGDQGYREKKISLTVNMMTSHRLTNYANSHKLTIDQAIVKLLETDKK